VKLPTYIHTSLKFAKLLDPIGMKEGRKELLYPEEWGAAVSSKLFGSIY